MNKSELLFDIDYLISPLIEEKLNGLPLDEKIDLLFKLLDPVYNLSDDEVSDIEHHYAETVGCELDLDNTVTLEEDEKGLIKVYALCFFDFGKAKNLLNDICNIETKVDAISKANYEIKQECDRKKQIADERTIRILENLVFDDDKTVLANNTENGTKKSIKRRKFSTIENQINLINNSKAIAEAEKAEQA
ncbi:MAG: hypothetical protein LUC97_05580 [Clostridiales bacterium]|nr:hypothetical protein [Clostridiales bacterium]